MARCNAKTQFLIALLLALAAAKAVPAQQIQPAPMGFLYTHLQSFEAKSRFVPQTPKERFHAYIRNLIGPATLVTESAAAGIGQALNSPWEWGQGGSGYAKRFANDMAYNGVRVSLTYLGSSWLHEDDRYFASEDRRTWPRIRHAVVSVFVAHKPDGSTVFASSSVMGIVGASVISRAWSPDSWQTGSNVLRSMGISVAGTVGFNLVREFLPDIIRRP